MKLTQDDLATICEVLRKHLKGEIRQFAIIYDFGEYVSYSDVQFTFYTNKNYARGQLMIEGSGTTKGDFEAHIKGSIIQISDEGLDNSYVCSL